MKELVREAIKIAQELGGGTFVGAVAVYLHTKSGRESRDLDLAMATIDPRELEKKGYRKLMENGKEVTRTPRGYKIDIYTEDVSGIPVETILATAKLVQPNVKSPQIRIASLEVLVVAKHRAARPQDAEDLNEIAHFRYEDINWESLRALTTSDHEYDVIKVEMDGFRRMPLRY